MRWNPLRIPAAVITALVLVVTLAGPAPAAVVAGPAPITGVGSGKCLDVNGGARTAKTGVAIRDCTGAANQAWTLTTNGELQVYDAATCLDVAGNDTTAPAVVQIYPCNGGSNQKWRLQTNGTIVGVQSGLCLDVTGRGTANGTTVGMWTCNGQTNQSWTTSLRTADTTAPTVPGNPRVSNLTCSAVTFAWNASTDAVGVAFYDIYHDGQLMTSVSGSTLSVNLSVVAGVTWGLFVNARDAAGNVSQASTTVPITPPQCQTDTQAPSAPGKPTASVSGTTVSS